MTFKTRNQDVVAYLRACQARDLLATIELQTDGGKSTNAARCSRLPRSPSLSRRGKSASRHINRSAALVECRKPRRERWTPAGPIGTPVVCRRGRGLFDTKAWAI